jgi:hypothetical protein
MMTSSRCRSLAILLDPTNIELLRVRLTAHGYDVVTAADGEQALERVRELEPVLVLLDVARINATRNDSILPRSQWRLVTWEMLTDGLAVYDCSKRAVRSTLNSRIPPSNASTRTLISLGPNELF